jgi:signal transduction histidine kinase
MLLALEGCVVPFAPTPLRVQIFSSDAAVIELCEELLQQDHVIVAGATGNGPNSPADLYICDLDHEAGPLPDVRPPAQCVVLVSRERVPADWNMAAPSIVAVKPINKARLAIVLDQAVAYQRQMAAGDALRADRQQLLQMLLHTNVKLQQYDQDRTNFLARAVHDFRAPITSMNGYCSLLLQGALGPLGADQRDVLGRVQRSIRRLSRMTAAIFQLSVGRQVEWELHPEAADPGECIEQCLAESEPVCNEKQISLSVQYTPPDRPLYFERDRIEQVLVNLLDNACRFTGKLGSIRVFAYPCFYDRRSARGQPIPCAVERRGATSNANNGYRIDIRDSGPGIPPEHLDSIFEEYTSYSGGMDRSGAGLGLAICRMIITQHQGTIWAESSPGGATFSFVLFHRAASDEIAPEPQGSVLVAQ